MKKPPRQTENQRMSDHGEEEEERPLCPASSGQSEIFTGFTGKPGSSATKVTEKLWSSPADLWLWAGSPLCRPPQGDLSETQSGYLASAIKSKDSNLRELDLSRNSLKEAAAELLCAGLESPLCRLETLRLGDCMLSERCLHSLVSALTRSHLLELDLTGNKHLMDSGVKLLSAGLKSPSCRLRILRLACCVLTEDSCASLSSALESYVSLEMLDLSGNSVKDSGVERLCAGLSPHCMLGNLRLSYCNLSERSCDYLASTLKCKPCRLKELDLSLNLLQDTGIKLLCDGLKSYNCTLKILRLMSCGVSDEGCAALVSALKSTPSDLTELDLSGNQLQEQGMKLMSDFAESPHCKLETLRVEYGQNLISPLNRLRKYSHLNVDPHIFVTLPNLSRPKPKVVEAQTSATYTPSHIRKTVESFTSKRSSILLSDLPIRRRRSQISPTDDDFLTAYPVTASTKPDLFEVKAKVMKATFHFTPDVLMSKAGGTSYRFRVLSPGVYQCALTKLAFTMAGVGELFYRILQWDESLLQAAGKMPAGPLYSIQCLEAAVCQLHLPHCATKPALLSEGLSVVHITGDGMSILKPLDITSTHVVVDVPHLSAFGLVIEVIKRLLNIQNPISGQILLFHRPVFAGKSRKVNVFLLPENIPLQEVRSQQENAEYIEATSSCHLIEGRPYSVHCPEAYRVQPLCAPFDFKYGPNYHPTFELRLTLGAEEATVTVRDQDERPVWEYHVELSGLRSASSSSPAPEPVSLPVQTEEGGSSELSTQPPANEPTSLSVPAEEGGPDQSSQNLPRTQGEDERKLFSVRTEFIDRISTSVLNDVLDKLLQSRVINNGEMESVQALPRAEKSRNLIDMVLKKGNPACKVLIKTLCDLDPFVSETLQLS